METQLLPKLLYGKISVEIDSDQHAIETVTAILDTHLKRVYFPFHNMDVCYDISKSEFIDTNFNDRRYTKIQNNFEYIMDRFFLQTITVNNTTLTIISGTIHRFEEVEYQGYPVNAYFALDDILFTH